jgi:AraC family transcriptional regulator, regulatory protein of adaptative response / methylated-DNA-[protein]-cysteine methyltransferase
MSAVMTIPKQYFDRNDEWWQAILARDQRYDGQFVFAVKSTKIFCRASCPSRRPHRERVTFYAVPEAAEQAGYRACKRCKPKSARILDPQLELVQRVCRYLEQSDVDDLKLSTLAEQNGISAFHLQRTFKALMGISPHQYATAKRFGRLKSLIKEGGSVTSAVYESGFNSSSRVYEQSAAELGMTPATYAKGGLGLTITYTIADSPLGRLLVAVTERGVCSVKMADTDQELKKDLEAEFPRAEIQQSDTELETVVTHILNHLNGVGLTVALPLDIRATAFQRRVWEELSRIPYGESRTYGEVARAIGKPGAVRAVGHACASNPVALLIPCHRVIREDKSLGGYRWGLKRKQKLLEREIGKKTHMK